MNSEQQGIESDRASSSSMVQQNTEEQQRQQQQQELETSNVVILAKTGDTPALLDLLVGDDDIPQAVLNRALLRTLSEDSSIHEELVGIIAQNIVELVGDDGDGPHTFRSTAVDLITRSVVRLLIETGGAGVNTVETFKEDFIGFTALHYACGRELESTVEYLCSCEGIDLSRRDRARLTPLSWAALTNNQPIFTMLLEAGANANGTFNEDPRCGNYLLQAVLSDKIGLVEALLDHGAALCIPGSSRHDDHGKTMSPIHVAKSQDMVNLLIKRGASIHDQDCHSNTPLVTVISPSVTLALLQAGANIHHVNKPGQNALMFACEMGNDEKVQVLLQHGACLSDPQSDQAITDAATNNHCNVVRLLLLTRKAEIAC